jgi:GTP-binding protein
MFVDEAKVHVKGGDGGAGCKSFRREKYRPKMGPDGGDGGRGGNVIVQADPALSTLMDFHRKIHYKAQRGTHGQGSDRDGAEGADVVLRVPVGTLVRDAETGDLIADLVHAGQGAVVARGGRGGRGNTNFVTPTRRAPAFAELGEPAEERWITLELKLLADAALVGMPSVGKSSLIARMSAARPKIADYPFTTLVPNLGVVKAGEHSFVVADVPGLIEGASQGAGLGHAFLRHIERTAVILHVLDLSGGYEARDPLADVEVIDAELAAHAKDLARRPRIMVGNKIDAENGRENDERVRGWCETRGLPYFGVSAVTGENVDRMMLATGELVHDIRARMPAHEEPYEELYVYEPPREREISVSRTDSGGYRVSGRAIERMVIMTDMENPEAVAFLQKRLYRAGVEDALTAAGARDGDEVTIGPVTFEWERTGGADADEETAEE